VPLCRKILNENNHFQDVSLVVMNYVFCFL